MGIIYLATNLLSGKAYTGLTTKTLAWRRDKHYTQARFKRKNGKKETHFGKALLKYDESVWQWTILEDNITDKDVLKQREIYWIAFYKSLGVKLYNDTNGGDGTIGYIKTPEHRAKIAATMRIVGKGNRKKGSKHSEAAKAKMSVSRKGISKSEEHRAKIAATLKEKAYAKTHAAKTYTLYTPDKKLITITNMSEFCRANGLNNNAMNKVANGRVKSAYGYTNPNYNSEPHPTKQERIGTV